MKEKRSLYQCFQAKVLTDRIRCAKGHSLSKMKGDGTIPVVRLVRGEPLELAICQDCNEYDEMGPPIPKEERGWAQLIDHKVARGPGRPRRRDKNGQNKTMQ